MRTLGYNYVTKAWMNTIAKHEPVTRRGSGHCAGALLDSIEASVGWSVGWLAQRASGSAS